MVYKMDVPSRMIRIVSYHSKWPASKLQILVPGMNYSSACMRFNANTCCSICSRHGSDIDFQLVDKGVLL